ncbi:MAG TPA: hypothetical protein VGD71_02570 [Kribbella sp.]
MVVPVAVPPLIEVQSFMRISLMIGIGGAGTAAHGSTTTSTSFLPRDDGFGPRIAYGVLRSPGMEKTNGTLKQIDQGPRLYSSSSSGVVFVDYAGNGALLRFAYPTVPPPARCGGRRAGARLVTTGG